VLPPEQQEVSVRVQMPVPSSLLLEGSVAVASRIVVALRLLAVLLL
jgi:hypothetical protein